MSCHSLQDRAPHRYVGSDLWSLRGCAATMPISRRVEAKAGDYGMWLHGRLSRRTRLANLAALRYCACASQCAALSRRTPNRHQLRNVTRLTGKYIHMSSFPWRSDFGRSDVVVDDGKCPLLGH